MVVAAAVVLTESPYLVAVLPVEAQALSSISSAPLLVVSSFGPRERAGHEDHRDNAVPELLLAVGVTYDRCVRENPGVVAESAVVVVRAGLEERMLKFDQVVCGHLVGVDEWEVYHIEIVAHAVVEYALVLELALEAGSVVARAVVAFELEEIVAACA